ncbi:FAD binding domain-containing protein [Dictyobacter formicarum]|uniref:Carbon monoxide dehydrogenase n=1 Tax=Dictyobacter formicarum TaxID=2778368 RepID=A0ABQ3VGW3_9CHLR|nr:FAD binding domain-containing protein [Dictyobacter formicarum]GHO84921.1 carbon monoxide dehydrogenase [Dictyobacter formicarum]
MKPPHFQYCAPGVLDEALGLLAQCGTDAKVLAGGQSLIPLLNMRLSAPLYLVDINRVAALDYIAAGESYLSVGAIVRQRSVEQSTVVRQRHPLLIEVIEHIGHMQIRNRGTLAGSIAHADPAAELPALLSCLDGEVVARSSSGERVIKAGQFFTDYLTTALDAQEIVTEIRFPWLLPQAGWACIEFSRRAGDYALAGAIAVVIPTPKGTCLSARISYFGISTTPVRGYEIEHMLAGTSLDDAVLQAAAHAAERLVDDKFRDIHATSTYRRALTAEATKRALSTAWQRCT